MNLLPAAMVCNCWTNIVGLPCSVQSAPTIVLPMNEAHLLWQSEGNPARSIMT